MNQFEEELQKNIEKGQVPAGEDLDARAYQEVFRVLKKDPGYQLSPGFAAKVVSKLNEKHDRSFSKDYLWFFTGLLFVLVTSAITLTLTNFRLDFGFLTVMSDYTGLALFGITFILFLNWLDKRLVKPRLTEQPGN